MFDDDASDDTLDPSPDARSPSNPQITNEPAKPSVGRRLDAGSVLNNLASMNRGELHCARRPTSAPSARRRGDGEHDPVIAIRTRNLGAALLGLGTPRRREEAGARRAARGIWDGPSGDGGDEHMAGGGERGRGRGRPRARVRAGGALPEVAEWFIRELDCGVLEPRPEPPWRENRRRARAPAGTRVSPMPSRRRWWRDATRTRARRRTTQTAPASASTSASAARLFAAEPAEGEDLLTPYAKPATAVVGGSDASPVWREVAAERRTSSDGRGDAEG